MIKLITFLSPLYICIFWFIIFIAQSHKSKPKLILSFFFITAAIQFVGNYIMFNNIKNAFVWYEFIYNFSTLSTLPLLYLYFHLIINSSKLNVLKVIPHFALPLVFSLINLAVVFQMDEHEHVSYMDYYLNTAKNFANSDSIFVNINSYLSIIQRIYFGLQIVFYVTIFVIQIKKFQKTILSNYSNYYKRELLWIKYFKYLLVLPGIFLIFMNAFGKQPYLTNEYSMLVPSSFFVIILFIWGLIGNHQNQLIIEIENDENRSETNEKSNYKTDHMNFRQKIEDLMIKDELFLDNDLKIWDLCILLNIQKKELTKLLQTEYNQHFYTFINTFRVNKAKSIIEQKSYNSIQDILDKSGFISLKEFIVVYKKIEKRNPDII